MIKGADKCSVVIVTTLEEDYKEPHIEKTM